MNIKKNTCMVKVEVMKRIYIHKYIRKLYEKNVHYFSSLFANKCLAYKRMLFISEY